MTLPVAVVESSIPADDSRSDIAKFGACNALNHLLDEGYFAEPRKPVDFRNHWSAAYGRMFSSAESNIALRRALALGKVRRIETAAPGYLYVEVDSTKRGSFRKHLDREPKITLSQAAALRRKKTYDDVIALASCGKKREEIAAAVGITMRTVSRYFAKARQEKLDPAGIQSA